MPWIDDHCHLLDERVGEEAVAEAAEAGVTRLVTVGVDVADSERNADLARRHDGVWATAGVHPHDASAGIDGLEALLTRPEVVAVGECGLDYHYDHSPRDVQREVFADQVALAVEHGLPLVVHTRDAWDDTFDILRATTPDRIVFHCFTGGPDEARVALALGGHLSFSGIVTFPSAGDLRAAAAVCPLDRVLVETDSPYLTPVPHRGRPNRPALVPLVGAAVAAAGGWTTQAVQEATWRNAAVVYALFD
jgi:TatD DNase family protein